MILADKIIKQRKQLGWSQEDLAEKVNVSRQSVSKWESASSIPDLNKIILMAEIFGVSTDYLLKDEIEDRDTIGEDKEPGVVKVSLEDATKYVETKIEKAKYVSIGVLFSIYSVIPLFFLLALSENDQPVLSSDAATAVGLVLLLISVSAGVSFFLRSNRYDLGLFDFENGQFELTYGVQSVYKEKLQNFQGFYTQRLSICVSMLIVSVVPLILTSMFSESDMIMLMMLVLMMVIIGASVYLMIPSITENNAYNAILKEGDFSPGNREETRRTEKLGAFYWPLVTAVYLGWSLLTMNWGITWIVWPVAAVVFPALIGLSGLLNSKNRN